MYLLKERVLLFLSESQVSVKQAMFAFNGFKIHSVSSSLFAIDWMFAKKSIGSCFLVICLGCQIGSSTLFLLMWLKICSMVLFMYWYVGSKIPFTWLSSREYFYTVWPIMVVKVFKVKFCVSICYHLHNETCIISTVDHI